MHVFNGILQNLMPFHPVKAHVMMLGEGGQAGVGWVRYFHLTETSCSPRRQMDDPALVWPARMPLAHGGSHFEEMLMPGEIDLSAIRRPVSSGSNRCRRRAWISVSRPWSPEL